MVFHEDVFPFKDNPDLLGFTSHLSKTTSFADNTCYIPDTPLTVSSHATSNIPDILLSSPDHASSSPSIPSIPPIHSAVPRSSHRNKNPPVWHKDYFISGPKANTLLSK